jgi:hypothetical protein
MEGFLLIAEIETAASQMGNLDITAVDGRNAFRSVGVIRGSTINVVIKISRIVIIVEKICEHASGIGKIPRIFRFCHYDKEVILLICSMQGGKQLCIQAPAITTEH